MIRYEITPAELLARIDALSPNWRSRARAAEQRMRKSGTFDDGGPAWSDIKTVFIELQHNKCAYCERQLETEDHGLVEHDVEHYRPKRAIKPWSHDSITGVGSGTKGGYYMLAYSPLNYCATCKTCNSTLKHQHFPILGKPGRKGAADIAKLNKAEQPCLPYPISDLDDDPESLITFNVLVPVPTRRRGRAARRAHVTIELLKLAEREQLQRERAELIRMMWKDFEALADHRPKERDRARRRLEQRTSGRLPHTACARAFLHLLRNDQQAAYRAYQATDDYLADSTGL